MKIKGKIISATPMICVLAYLLIGFVWNIWHPTWVIFFLIPIVPVILYTKVAKIVYPVICVVIFLLLGFISNLWHPAWLIFLTIPIFNIFFEPGKKRKCHDCDDKDVEFVEYTEEEK